MEKAILKTLIYANIFGFPLKGYEVLKWLIGRETSLIKVEQGLNRLVKKKKIQTFKDFYFLKRKKKLIDKRLRRQKISKNLLLKAKILTQVLKIIPWVKLVGISGGLAVDNCSRKDDIDLFLITDKNRIWLSRFFATVIFDFLRVRRKVNMKPMQASGKFCFNTILDEEHLEQSFKDSYTAHEVLQMRPLWQKEGIYTKYLSDNDWAFEYLPNWTSRIKYSKIKKDKGTKVVDLLEIIARWLQIKLMKKSTGLERVEEGGLYFHPLDKRAGILKEYYKKISSVNL